MTILCELDQLSVDGIAPALGGAVRLVSSLPEAAIAVVDDDAENLVVVGRDTPLEQVLDFTVKVRHARPELNVILVRNNYDPNAISAALQAGVREVVPSGDPSFVVDAIRRAVAVPVSTPAQPTLVDELMRPAQAQVAVALEEAPPEVAQQQRAGQVITVFSPKGGSGKTTISTNLAVALSRLAPPVCLIDLDLEFGDVAISLRLAPNRTLADAVKLEVEGDEDEALQMLTTDYSDGLKCILAPIEPGDAEKIPSELITDLIALLRPRYSYIVIDTPSQLSPHVLAALDASDHHVLLTNPEIPSLKNLRLTLDMLDLLHYPRERRSVIFNRADAAAGLSAEEVESTIKTSLTASVPASRDVPASINRGVPIVAAKPDHAVSTAIINFAAERIVGVAPAGRARSRRLFRRKPA